MPSSAYVQYSPPTIRIPSPVMPIDDLNKSRRKRLSAWMRRHQLMKRPKKDRGKKKGCTVLHTSTNKHSRSIATPDVHLEIARIASTSGILFPEGAEHSPMSFHSCYSYEREGYQWWWYHTASEVLRSYLTSLHGKVDTYLRPKESMLSSAPGSVQFTPRLDMTFKTCLGSDYLNSNCSTESFWETGFGILTPAASTVATMFAGLNPNFTDARGNLFTPPIHDAAHLGWSEIEEAKFDFISLRPPTSADEVETEISRLAQSMRGHWITLMNRCSDIEQQFKYMGVNYVKRGILARIAIPLTMFQEDQAPDGSFNNLHTWIHTPIGLRHINWSTVGDVSIDNDPDCGKWHGLVRTVSLHIPSVDRTVRALQRIMSRPSGLKDGITIETRCVLPDFQEGCVLFFQVDTYPNAFYGDYSKGTFHTSRILRYEHPVDNVKQMTSKTALTESGALKDCSRLDSVVIA